MRFGTDLTNPTMRNPHQAEAKALSVRLECFESIIIQFGFCLAFKADKGGYLIESTRTRFGRRRQLANLVTLKRIAMAIQCSGLQAQSIASTSLNFSGSSWRGTPLDYFQLS